MTKGKEKLSSEADAKPSAVSDVSQRPTLPRLPPRYRSQTFPEELPWRPIELPGFLFACNDRSDEEEEEAYTSDHFTPEELRRYILIMRRDVQAQLKAQRWKPFAGA